MSVIEINTDPSRRQLNQFGFVWLFFFVAAGTVTWFRFHSLPVSLSLGAASIVVPVVGWTVPRCMRWVYVGMSYLAWPIGFVVSHVVLALVYYLVLTPVGLALRALGHDPLTRRFDPEAETYWVTRPTQAVDPRRYFRQF